MIWRESRETAKTWKKKRDEKKRETGLRKPRKSETQKLHSPKAERTQEGVSESKLTNLSYLHAV